MNERIKTYLEQTEPILSIRNGQISIKRFRVNSAGFILYPKRFEE